MPDVKVRITAEDAGSSNVRNFGNVVKNVNDDIKGAQASWQKYTFAIGAAVGVMAGAVGAAKALGAALNEGAQLELAQSRFENLAASIGTTADALTTNMGRATQGMMSQASMVSAASDIISLGLADSGDEVVRLSNLVGQLGWDMQVLTLTMANDSMLRLDALGLSMTDVKNRMEELKAAGIAADEAFDLAVIEAGEAKLELMGSAADSTVGKIQQLTAIWENATAAFKIEFAESVADQLATVAGAAQDAGPAIEAGLGSLGQRAGRVLGAALATGAADGLYLDRKAMEDQLAAMGVSWRELAQARQAAINATGLNWIDIAGNGRNMLEYETAATEILRERYGLLLDLLNLNQRDDRDAAEMALVYEATAAGMEEAATAADEYGDSLIKVAEAEGAVVAAASQVGERIRALAALADVAADAMARGADKAGVMAGAMSQLGDVAKGNALAEQAAAAEALAATYEEAAARMAGAFTAALGEGGGFDFGNLDAMSVAAWDIAQAFELTAPQMGQVGIALGEITPQMAEAAVKAGIFQEAWGNLLGQFGAGNIDTSQLTTAYDALIADLNSKSLVEIQVELKQVENPARELWAWLPKEERQTVEIPVEFTPEQAALSQAIDLIDGIPEDQSKIITFDAEYTEVETAITTIETDIAAIDAAVLMTPETTEVDAAIQRIDQSRLTIYVDYVNINAPETEGRATGGPVTGGTPYIIGEAGPEIFVPWTSGTVIPNHRIAQRGGGGDLNLTLNFYGPTNGGDVRRAADDAGRLLLERVRQAGVPV